MSTKTKLHKNKTRYSTPHDDSLSLMNKKAIAMEWIIMLIILLITMVLILLITRGFFSDSAKNIQDTQQGIFNDQDTDGIPDINDQCKDTPRGSVVNARGCSDAQIKALEK